MAITKVIEIKVDAGHATKSLDKLGDTINEQKQITIEFEEELSKLEEQLKQTSKSSFSLGRADTKKRIEGLKTAIKDQRLGLKKLNLERSKVGALNKNIEQQKKLSETYFESKEGMVDVNRLTSEYALKLQAVKNVVRAATESVKKFALAQKLAFAATGIGAVLLAVTALVTYWDDIVELITRSNIKLKNQLTLVQSIQGVLSAELATINKQLELNKLQGKANEELEKQRVAILERLREQNEAEIKILENQLDRLKATSIEVGFWETIKTNVAFTLFGTKALASESANLAAQRLAEINDLESAIEKSKLKEIDLAIQLFNIENPEVKERDPLEKVEGVGFDAEASQREFEAREEANALKLQQELEFNMGLEEIGLTSARIRHDTEVKWADLTAQAKLGIAGAVLQDAAGLVDKNSVAGKGIAIAQTGINTTQGIMQAFATLPTIAAIPAAGIVGALGIKSILDITKQKIPSATGRGFVGGGASVATAPQAPSFNLVEGNENSQLNDSIQGIGQNPVKAFVVSSDMTTSQELDRNIEGENSI